MTKMEPLKWDKDWESGNKTIDEQHHHLVDLGNTLLNLFKSDPKSPKIADLFETMVDDIARHFYCEEKVLKELKYPHLEIHKALHLAITVKASELKEKHQRGEAKNQAFVSFLIEDFIVGHIEDADVKFFPLTREQAMIESLS